MLDFTQGQSKPSAMVRTRSNVMSIEVTSSRPLARCVWTLSGLRRAGVVAIELILAVMFLWAGCATPAPQVVAEGLGAEQDEVAAKGELQDRSQGLGEQVDPTLENPGSPVAAAVPAAAEGQERIEALRLRSTRMSGERDAVMRELEQLEARLAEGGATNRPALGPEEQALTISNASDSTPSQGLSAWFHRRANADTAGPEAETAAPEAVALQPGDAIKVEVFREPDCSGVFQIDQEGMIRHPLLGAMQLGGMTIKEAGKKIETELSANFLVDPRVVVSRERAPMYRIVLLGQVIKPGVYSYPMADKVTVLEAIATAGGLTELASADRTRLVRTTDGRTESIPIRVSRMLAGREPDVELRPNDVITVPEARF